MCRLANPLPIEAFCSVSSGTHGTILLPTRHARAKVQGVIPRRMASGWWSGVSQVVKTAQSRGRTERTLLNAVIFLSADAPSRERECCEQAAIRRFDLTLRFATAETSCGRPLMLFW
jgi:hypothetical protein